MQKKIEQYREKVEEQNRRAEIATDDRTRNEHLEVASIYLARAKFLDQDSAKR